MAIEELLILPPSNTCVPWEPEQSASQVGIRSKHSPGGDRTPSLMEEHDLDLLFVLKLAWCH